LQKSIYGKWLLSEEIPDQPYDTTYYQSQYCGDKNVKNINRDVNNEPCLQFIAQTFVL
jgi:hypothetical protein